ncbi:putative aliphatic sulfonates-binding protein precursor [compost metagenome]
MKKSIWLGSILILVSAMILSACGKETSNKSAAVADSSNSTVSTNGSKPFTIKIGNNGGSNQLKLAYDRGWFDEEFAKINGKVEYAEFQSGPQAIESIAAKRLDVTTLVDGGVFTALGGKIDLTLVSYLSSGLKGINYIIVPKGSDIKELADLKGKSIGLSKGTTNHVFFVKAIQSAGIEESEVNIVNLLIPDAQPAFQSGQLDAWVAPDPFTYQEVHKNGASIIASGESLNIASPVFTAFRSDFTKEHPEAVEAYLRVIQRSVDYEKTNYEEAVKEYAALKGQDVELIKSLADNYGAQNELIPNEVVADFQKSADLLVDLRYLKEKYDVSKLIDNSYIQNAK